MTEAGTTVLLAGAEGQLGRSLLASAPPGLRVHVFGHAALDITNLEQVRRVAGELGPDLIINAAAYTAVDQAEREPDWAFAVNAGGVANLATAAAELGARLLTVSSDFVFDGRSGLPYAPGAAANPLNVYGASKLAGEQAAGPGALIVRTAWVHGRAGYNFVKTILRLLAERREIRVVADQIGSPTSATDLAAALWKLAAAEATGVHHYTNSGVASWYDLAIAIAEEARGAGMLNSTVPIVPVGTAEFPTPALRPPCAVLDKQTTFALLGGPAPHWRDGLRRTLQELKHG